MVLHSGTFLFACLVSCTESSRLVSQRDHRRRRDPSKPKVTITTTTPKPRDIGPVYKCETVPTGNVDKYLSCSQDRKYPEKEGKGLASCFSLVPTMKWFCPKDKVAPNWLEMSQTVCAKKKDKDHNLYDGRCLHAGHKDYVHAVDYSGPGLLASRRVHIPHHWDPKSPLWYNEPRYKLEQPPISRNAIGWNPTGVVISAGKWCEAHQPSEGWSPGKGLCTHTGTTVTILSYNLYWWNLFGVNNGNGVVKNTQGGFFKADRAAGRTMEMNGPFDIMGFQECDDVNRIVKDANLAGLVEVFAGHNAIANAWRKDKWKALQNGYDDVTEDHMITEWSGRRGVVWSRLQNKQTKQVVFFINHHGPLPDNSGGFCGPHAMAYRILQVIAERAHKGDVVILVGDFNAMKASTVTNVLNQHLANSYHGESFNGVDKFYHNCAESVRITATDNYGAGGSDHDALSVTYEI